MNLSFYSVPKWIACLVYASTWLFIFGLYITYSRGTKKLS